MSNLKRLVIISLLILLIFSCTDKKNTTGFPGSEEDIRTKIVNANELGNFFFFFYSTGNSNSSSLLVGNYNEIPTYSFIRFTSLPDSIYQIENINVKLYIKDSYNFDESNIQELNFGKVLTKWYEFDISYFISNNTESWSNGEHFSENDYEELSFDNINLEEDTLSFTPDSSLINYWIENDSLNYGFVIRNEQLDQVVEFHSSEETSSGSDISYKPVLSFDYKPGENDTLQSYSTTANYDSFIYKNPEPELTIGQDILKVANIIPQRICMDMNLTDSLFTNDEESGINNADDYSLMTIIKAELIFHIKDLASEFTEDFDLKPYLVIKDSINYEAPEIPYNYNEDYISYGDATTFSDSAAGNEVKIDITSITQAITSGYINNNGDIEQYNSTNIILHSINEHDNYKFYEFYTKNADDTDMRPYIKITYTPPNLDN